MNAKFQSGLRRVGCASLCCALPWWISSLFACVLSFELGAAEVTEFLRAVEPRGFEFPRDYGSHPEYQTEWWYLTGSLEDERGAVFGFQATWFRRGLRRTATPRTSTLAARDAILFHGALTDVNGKRFAHEHATSRAASTWAGSNTDGLNVWLFEHVLRSEADGTWSLNFTVQGRRVALKLRPRRPPLLHGATPGLSIKGSEPGQASYYVSHTRMEATGTLQASPGETPRAVRGTVWYDQEFGSNQLSADQIGWDWFSVPLDEGTDLMLYRLRRSDGSADPTSSGTLRFADGRRVHLSREAATVEVLKHWTSPHTGAKYPAGWTLTIPQERLELSVAPLLDDQELRTERSTNVNYWEGLCGFEGRVQDQPAKGRGYVELVGYAGAFKGRL